MQTLAVPEREDGRENPFPTLEAFERRFEKQQCWFCSYPFSKHETPHKTHGQRSCQECIEDIWCVYTHVQTDNGFLIQVPDEDHATWATFIKHNSFQAEFLSSMLSTASATALQDKHSKTGVFLGDWEYHHVMSAIGAWLTARKVAIRTGRGTESELEELLAEDLGL